MDLKSQGKGGGKSPVRFRYSAQNETLEQIRPPTDSGKDENATTVPVENKNEEVKSKDSSPVSSKPNKITESLEDGSSKETWRMLKEMKGRITKTVEEKIEEIKSDRVKRKLANTSSLSDSEDRSEQSGQRLDSDLADISDASFSPEQTTPQATDSPTEPTSNTPKHEYQAHHFSKRIKAGGRKAERGRVELGVEAIEGLHWASSSGDPPHKPIPLSAVSFRFSLYAALFALLYICLSVPQFLFGVLVGAVVSAELGGGWGWLVSSEQSPTTEPKVTTPSTNPLPQLEGWVNEFCYEYSPENYHISQTETVYARLKGTVLRLASPRARVAKRARWDEPTTKPRFDRERTYDLTGCQVILLPSGLAHRRLWSKKYPICIVLKPDSHLGTRYRERGTPSLELGSFQQLMSKTEGEENFDQDTEDGNGSSKPRKESISLDDDEMLAYSDEEDGDTLSSDYVKIPASLINKSNIYLFARTDREKDIWFRRLVAAVKSDSSGVEATTSTDPLLQHYYSFISRCIGTSPTLLDSCESIEISEEDDENLVWLNLFLGRILYDPMHDSYWMKQIQEKIQKKISAIKVPGFMEQLVVSRVELADCVPRLERAGLPHHDLNGLWLELDLSYKGTFNMAIDTKINLLKLKDYYGTVSQNEDIDIQDQSSVKSAIFDSDVEDSAESSCDDVDVDESINNSPHHRRNTPQKVLQMVDKIASSKYFQQVTENKYVKKALEGVSNTTISLVVHVKSLTGTIVLNFPPPPSDRLWYGFRPNTKLSLSAKPKVGQRGINMVYITNYIEKKLVREFEKLLVMPNMDDLIIPIMNKEKPS